jgi:hypothetical protein
MPKVGNTLRRKNPLHSKATVRWGTSEDVVERGRRVMGRIGFDPCSEERFNDVVKADKYYSLLERGENALKLPWFDDALVNPPGGFIRQFWEKLIAETMEGRVTRAIWVGFSMEQLGQLADATVHFSDFSICFVRKRIKFKRHDGYSGSPSHANYIAGVGVDRDAFDREFGAIGKVQHGPLAMS